MSENCGEMGALDPKWLDFGGMLNPTGLTFIRERTV